jgi:putative membrane protein
MSFRPASLFKHFAHGLLMGGADIVPGVSGGTMALIVGVYERLVASVSSGFRAVLALLRLNIAEAREQFLAVSWTLIIPLGAGIVTALLIGARFIPYLLETYPMQCRGLFFGLIAASLVIPWQRISHRGGRAVTIAVGAAVLAFALAGLPPGTIENPALWQIFGGAAIAICAMILPGVSGAFLLLVLGLYEPTLRAVDSRNMPYVLTFIAGAGIGIGTFSLILTRLLKRYHDVTMAALVGLMAGSLRALWPWQTDDRVLHLPETGDPVISVLLLGLAGFAFVLALHTWSVRQLRQQDLLQVNS